MDKICFIGHFPPPISGLTKAVDTLYNSELSKVFAFEKINIGHNNKKILNILRTIKKSEADLFYFTIGQSKGGNLRDLAILRAVGNRPCVVHLHGGYYRVLVDKDMSALQRKLNYRAVKKLSGTIVLGPSLKWIFQGMVPEEKIFTVPNCVDDEYLMSDDDFQEKIRTLPERKIKHILYLSNFIRSKGYPEVLEMAKLEKERIEAGGEKKFHFDFAGSFLKKSDEVFFWDYVNGNGLDDYVTYHGVVDGDQKRELLKRSDVFCLLTNYPNEGQPISILEAMGNGMVIVTTDHAGIPDQVTDGINGLVVPKDKIDAKSVFARLCQMTDFEPIALKNRQDTLSKYMQSTYVNNMRAVFQSVIDNTGGRRQ